MMLTQPCHGLSKVKLATVTAFVTQQQRLHDAECKSVWLMLPSLGLWQLPGQ